MLMTPFVSRAQSDILMVTDGQIPNPRPELLDRIATARGALGLEVHGLIVGDKTQARHASARQIRGARHLKALYVWSAVPSRVVPCVLRLC